jgi:hypothetical protein
MELLEDAGLVLFGYAWTCVAYNHIEVAVDSSGAHEHLTRVGELDGVTYEVEEHLSEALLVANASG